MGVVAIFFGLIAIALLIGAALGWVALFKAARIEQVAHRLERRLRTLERKLEHLGTRPGSAGKPTPSTAAPESAPQEPRPKPASTSGREPDADFASIPGTERPADVRPAPEAPAPEPATESVSAAPTREPDFLGRLIDNMQRNWMAWLGGVSVSLAGIFLVGYGIEMGYLGPRARIVAAVIAGVSLHAAAEYFRRRSGAAHPAFGAMAGGGSITLFAAFYAALELYRLLSPGLTFTLLAVVSLISMALAVVHGPLLAVIGILGAFIVPLLVNEHAGGSLVELGYSLIVSASALLLMRFVYRPWLWYGTLAGALSWWLVSLGGAEADGYRGYYLAAFTYLALALPTFDWRLRRRSSSTDPATETVSIFGPFSTQSIGFTIGLIGLAQAASIVHLGFTGPVSAVILWSPLIAIVLWATRTRPSLALAPWFLLVTQLGAWLVTALDESSGPIRLIALTGTEQRGFLGFALAMAILFSAGSALVQRGRGFSHAVGSLMVLAPVLWLALSYLLVTDLSTDWRWGTVTLAFGLTYITLSGIRLQRDAGDGASIWLILGGHLAYSLAVAMFFREATLTLALATQIISLAWLKRSFEVPALDWIVKGVLALVIARLTLNPWLLTYPSDVHWSLWTYGGAVVCCFAGTQLTSADVPLRKWLEAATLHLLVLFLGAEVRYWLYDGNIFTRELTLTEAAINASLWSGLGITYYQRGLHSEHLASFYKVCSRVLLVLGLLSYALTLSRFNPLWSDAAIAATPVWNLLLLAYGAPPGIALIAWFAYDPAFRRWAAVLAGGGLFLFVSLEIRHLWHGALDLDLGTRNGEVYTYSAVWLLMAVVTMLASTWRGSRDGYRAGIALLFVVIGKIFLIDMSDLEGLLRVASFMGLGLALLGLAWLYQRTARHAA